MRLRELTYPNTDRKTIQNLYDNSEVISFLQSKGFQNLTDEDAKYSTVWGHARLPYVLKIFKTTDVCYEQFIKLAETFAHNPHFPKFRGKKMMLNDEYFAIRMEKLSPMPKGGHLNYKFLFNHIEKRAENARYDTWLDEYDEFYPELGEACDLCRIHCPKICSGDIHSKNVMYRNDQPVIIDPWAP